MFKAVSFFRIAKDFILPPLDAIEEALQATRFTPCGATQAESSGWVPPRGNKSTVLAESVGPQLILRLCTERRPLPASAVKDAVEQRIEKYKQETGHERVGSGIKREFRDEASLTGADKVVSQLLEALSAIPGSGAGLMARPVQTTVSAAIAMAHWLASREAPVGFTIDRDCELKMPDDQKSTVRYSRHTLEIDEVAEHIAAGKVPTQLAMTWNDRVSFVLTDMTQIRKLKLLDVVLDGVQDKGKDDDGFDADAAIVTGELSALIPDLLEALGGELAHDAELAQSGAERASEAAPGAATA